MVCTAQYSSLPSRSLPGSSSAWANARLIVTAVRMTVRIFEGDIDGDLVPPTPRSAASSRLLTQPENLRVLTPALKPNFGHRSRQPWGHDRAGLTFAVLTRQSWTGNEQLPSSVCF